LCGSRVFGDSALTTKLTVMEAELLQNQAVSPIYAQTHEVDRKDGVGLSVTRLVYPLLFQQYLHYPVSL
jgi:hypothetical protein